MAASDPSRGKPLTGRKILVVEDEYFLADDMARALRDAGATVVALVGDLKEALRTLETDIPIDGAVLDINIRGEVIYPVADILRERSIPFVFTTGYDQATLAPAYLSVRRFEKPLRIAAVAEALSTGP